MALGILLVSHVPAIANGVETLIKQVAKDVPITTAGGTSDGKIGTDLDHIQKAIGDNPASDRHVRFHRPKRFSSLSSVCFSQPSSFRPVCHMEMYL